MTAAFDAAHEREQLRLLYIWESLAYIAQYTPGGREEFFAQTILQDAVLRRLETLADAALKLTDALKTRHPDIAWSEVYRFRNVLAHAYEAIDLERVWAVVEHHLPALREAVSVELDELPEESDAR